MVSELFRWKNAITLDSDPIGTGKIGSRKGSFYFQQFSKTFRSRSERENSMFAPAQVGKHEHLSTNGFISYPEDKVISPLHGFFYMREGKEVCA